MNTIKRWKIRRYSKKTWVHNEQATLEEILNLEKETAILLSHTSKKIAGKISEEREKTSYYPGFETPYRGGLADGSLPDYYPAEEPTDSLAIGRQYKNPNFYMLRKRLRLLGKWRNILISQSQSL